MSPGMPSPTDELATLPLTRRIVTGHHANAESQVIYDDTDGGVESPHGSTDTLFQTLWLTDEVPADCSSKTENDPTQTTLPIANDGSICRVVWARPGISSPMHRTQSVDYGIVLEGEIELELDNGERKLMKTGDIVVQRGTMHAWHNRHATKWAKLFFVLIKADGIDMPSAE